MVLYALLIIWYFVFSITVNLKTEIDGGKIVSTGWKEKRNNGGYDANDERAPAKCVYVDIIWHQFVILPVIDSR